MKVLDFEAWRSKGNLIKGRKLPKYHDLFAQPVKNFSYSNTLYDVLVETAMKSARQGSATIITGSLYSRLIQYTGSSDEEPGYSAEPSDVLLVLQQFAVGVPKGSVPALDYLVYFVLAFLQEHNPKVEGMETLLLSQMTRHASIVACKARADWFWFQYKITRPKSAPVEQATPPSSPERSPKRSPESSPERSPERSPEHSPSPKRSPERNSDRKQQS